MLKILQTFDDGSRLVRDYAYRGAVDEESHEERVPMDFTGLRVPEVSPKDLWEGYASIDQDGIKGRIKNWTAIGPVLQSMDIMLTSTFVHEGRADAVSVGRFSVAHSDQVPSVLQHFALCLLTGRIGMEEDETQRLNYFVLDEQRCKGREPFNLEEYRGNKPRDLFDGIALALREIGLVRSFEPSLIKVTRADGKVLWGRIDKGLMVPVEEPGEMTIPGTELVAPKDAQERINALSKIWVGVGEDKEMAFKARAAMAWAISTIQPQGKILTWFDDGGTGKTSFIAGFNACFPSKAASVSWDAINRGGFDAGLEFSHLIGKTVSFSDETSQLGKKDGALAAMKALSTGDTKTVRYGAGRSAEVYLHLWQVLFSNTGSIFPKGYAFERRLVHMPLVSEAAARRIPREMHGRETLGDWLFSEAEVGKTFMALAIAGQGVWEEDFHCAWPKALEKWEGEEDDASDNQFCLPPKDSDMYLEASVVADILRGQSNIFVNGLRKLARVWNAGDGWFYGDHDVDSSATGRIPRTFMLLDDKTPAFNSTLTAGHDPATVSGFIPDATDGTVKNFAKMLKELGVESKTITRRGEFYTGGPNSLKAPHAGDSPTWKAVRIVLGVQSYGSAVYEAPEVEHEEDTTTQVDTSTTTIPPVGPTIIPPVDETPSVIPPVPSPIKMPRAKQQAIHKTYGAEGDLIAVYPAGEDAKLPKGKWSLKAKADGTAKTVKTWPDGEEACAFIPTGKTVLLDLDCHNDGKSGWDVLNEEVGVYGSTSFPKTLGELTPSGGIHLLYHVSDASFVERLKSVSHVDGIEVDVKANGKGQAVCAGSVITGKGKYRVCSLPETSSIAEMSEAMKSWLARKGYVGEDPAVIERRRKEEEERRARVRAERDARRALGEEPSKPAFLSEMESEFDAAIDSVATASSGGRNSSLNETAFKLFSKSKKFYADFQDEDWLDDESIKERLVSAGLESGLEKSEVIATVESAWVGVFGGTTTVAAPVVAPVIEPEEAVEVQSLVNEDLNKTSSKGESLFQATGYHVDWRGNFHKVSQEELELIHEDDGWGEPVNSTETSQEIKTTQEELEAIHEDDDPNMDGLFGPDGLKGGNEDYYTDRVLTTPDGIDGWGNTDYVTNYEIIPLDEEPNPHHGGKDPDLDGFGDDGFDGWVNAVDDVYDSTYPIVPLAEEIDFDELLGF